MLHSSYSHKGLLNPILCLGRRLLWSCVYVDVGTIETILHSPPEWVFPLLAVQFDWFGYFLCGIPAQCTESQEDQCGETVGMDTHIHTQSYTHLTQHTHTHIAQYTYSCTHIAQYSTHRYAHTHTHIQGNMHNVVLRTQAHIHTQHTHTYTHTRIHPPTHTHTPTRTHSPHTHAHTHTVTTVQGPEVPCSSPSRHSVRGEELHCTLPGLPGVSHMTKIDYTRTTCQCYLKLK